MVQFETVLSLLGSALSIWDNHEKTYFLKKYIRLNTEFYEEKNKDKPDFAVLDNIKHELYILISAFNSSIKGSNTPNPPK